jgi:aspartyl protease family protein
MDYSAIAGRKDGPQGPRWPFFGADMLKSAILFAVSAVTLATLTAPFLSAPPAVSPPAQTQMAAADPTGERAPTAADSRAGEEATRPASGYREAVLKADSRGQYGVDALVNGMPVRMVVDTGASMVVVSAQTAARLALMVRPDRKWTIRTANGTTTASPVTLDHLSFGGLFMNDVEALVLPAQAGDVNLLGASFLKRVMSVEQRDGVLILRQ